MSRAITEEEAREEFLDAVRETAHFWANLPDKTPEEKCNGVAFSILVILDGCHGSLPAYDLLLSPHEDDKEYNIAQGENWYEPGMMINDCHLHEMFHK